MAKTAAQTAARNAALQEALTGHEMALRAYDRAAQIQREGGDSADTDCATAAANLKTEAARLRTLFGMAISPAGDLYNG